MTSVSTTAVTINQPLNPLVTLTPTDIVNPKVTHFVERYRFYAKASAENIIQLATTLVEAGRELSQTELTAFCKEIGVNQKSSTYRKLTHIGLNATRFDDHLDRLPTAWTTVYNLSKLSEHDFEKVVANDNFSPTMTAKSINEIVGPTARPGTKRKSKAPVASPAVVAEPATPISSTSALPLTSPRTILINLDGIAEDDVVEVFDRIEIMRIDMQFTFQMSNGLRELLAREALSPDSHACSK